MPSPISVSHVFHVAEGPGRHVWGGAERHLRILLPALAARGLDVEAIVLATNPGPVVDAGVAELRAHGVRVTCLYRPSEGSLLRKLPAFLAQHRRLLALLRRRRDRIVHLHLDMVWAPLVAAAARCPKVVMTVHVDHADWLALRWRAWLRLLDRTVARYVAISCQVREHYRQAARVPVTRMDVVEYGLPEPGGPPVQRAQLGLAKSSFVVGFVGRLVEQKNLFILIDAVGGLKGIEVVLVGDGPLRARLERHAAGRGFANIRFAGAIEDAGTLMPLFDLLCLPSRFEGLGLVLLEAMSRGVPCLGSRAGAIPEILGDGRYGFLADARSAASLRAAILEASANRAAREALARAALQRVRTHFSVERMAEGTHATYRAVEAMPRRAVEVVPCCSPDAGAGVEGTRT